MAGGENTRYPSPKAFTVMAGETIIERSLRILGGLCERVVISTNEPELYFHLGAPLVGDVLKGAGPMAGIASVLHATGAKELLVAACDMPFIREELLKYIIDNRGGEATVPVMNGRPEPLLAVYSRDALGTMESMLAE